MKKVLFSLLALVLLLVGFAPSLLSTSWGKERLVSILKKQSGHDVTIQSLKLSWFGDQRATGVQILQQKSVPFFRCEKISSSASLWQILVKHDFEALDLTSPSCTLRTSDFIHPAPRIEPKLASFIPDVRIDSAPFSAKLHVQEGEVLLLDKKALIASYKNIKMDAVISQAGSPISWSISGETQEGAIAGHFRLSGKLGKAALIDTDLSNFPLYGIDALLTLFYPDLRGFLLDGVGPSLNLSLKAELSEEALSCKLDAKAAFLSAQLQTIGKGNLISLSNPGNFALSITPQFAEKISQLSPALANLRLKGPLKGAITIETFSVPNKNGALDLPSLAFKASLSTEPALLHTQVGIDLQKLIIDLESPKLEVGIHSKLDLLARANEKSCHIAADGQILELFQKQPTFTGSWQAEGISLTLIEEMMQGRGKLVPILGEKLSMQGSVNTKVRTLTLALQTDTLSLPCAEMSWQKDLLSLKSPVTLSLALSPLLAQEIGAKTGALELNLKTAAIPLTGTWEELRLDADFLTHFVTDTFHFPPVKGSLKCDTLRKVTLALELGLAEQNKERCIFTVSSEGSLDLPKQALHMGVQFELAQNNKPSGAGYGIIDAKALFSPEIDWKIVLDGQNLSLALLDKIFKQPETLTTLFGSSLQLHLEAQKEKVDLSATTPELNVKGALTWKDGSLRLATKTPLEIYYTLTDERFKCLAPLLTNRPPLFEISQPTTLALSVSCLNFPFKDPFNSKELSLLADGGFDRFVFQEIGSKNPIKMDHLVIKIEKKESASPLAFALSSQISTKASGNGTIALQGKLIETSDLSKLSLDFGVDIEQFPTAILDLATHLLNTHTLSPLFGETLDAKANVQLTQGSGPIQFNIHSPNTRIDFKGGVKEGVVTLFEPAHAQVLMTEELSHLVLKEVNPLSISSITSPHPFTLEIDKEDFSLPLNDWKKLSLARARIELGQISCRNEGALQITLGLLKSKTLSNDKQLNLWFAPIDLSIKEGQISLERSEILVSNTFEIATWGALNLLDEKVDMTLGLTAQCLAKAFSINNLPSDYVMHISMRGKMDNVKLDTKAATAKIAALLIWQQRGASGSGGLGGLPGAAFGELLGRMATLPDKGGATPAAKHPFPWEKYKPSGKERKKEGSSSDEPKKKNRIKKGDKPLKQLLKVLR